jgi:methanogen homocitrate synthase
MREKYFQEDRWSISPYNFEETVLQQFELPTKVKIHDATLRDGEQTPGVVFRKEDKVRIARLLDEVGVDRIEAGMPAVSEEDFQAMKEISASGLNAEIFSFARALPGDIDKAVECGCTGVVIEIPIGYPKLLHQFGWTWEDVLRKSVNCIKYARERGLYVVYFPYDTTRARYSDLTNLFDGIMNESPPDSIGIVDTMGCALPEAIKYLVKMTRERTGLPVEVHTHNDFGMGVACEIAGIVAGAEVVHSCVNGLGERTGNAALEELIMGMQILLGMNTGYRLDRLLPLSKAVEEISRVSIACNKPVIGERNYTRESGIGIELVLQKPLAMFAVAPSVTGRAGEIVLGKKSGKGSVEYMLGKLGIGGLDDETVNKIVNLVKSKGAEKRGLLSEEEFVAIVSSVSSNS